MKIRERRQVTIPKELRERYGLHKDVHVDFIGEEKGIPLVKRTDAARRVAALRGNIKLKYEKSVDEYIEEIGGR